MSTEHKRNRPIPKDEADFKAFGGAVTSLPDAVDMLNGIHVLMVAYKVAGEIRYRRRFYVNLAAAEKAKGRAIMRGHAASITLCKLAPTRTFGGGWSA